MDLGKKVHRLRMSHGLEPNAHILTGGKAANLALNVYVKSQ